MPQVIGIPRETYPEEKRVATVPEVVAKLIKLGFKVIVQAGAGALLVGGSPVFINQRRQLVAGGPPRVACKLSDA